MAIWDKWRSKPEPSGNLATQATLADVLQKYELVEVVENGGDPFIIVADERPVAPGQTVQLAGDGGRNVSIVDPSFATTELGSTSPSPFASWARREYNNELIGMLGLQKYDRMRRSDGTVRGTLRALKTPVLAGRWFVEAESEATADQNAADFIWKCLTEYMSISWTQFLTEAMLMCDFGYYMFEKVWDTRVVDGKQRMVLKKLAPRHPMDVQRWIFDANGGPAAVVMYPNYAGGPDVIIPIEKLLVFTFDMEAGNIEGISVLRSAYKHWFYKEQLYKIDAIQKERHGIGVPVIKLPPGYSKNDLNAANDLGRNLRTNERAHVVLPPFWELIFAKLEGHVVDALKSVEHHNLEIEKNILAAFLDGKVPTKLEDQDMFLKATRFLANIVCDVINHHLIPQMIDYNYVRVNYPSLRVRRIGESADWRTLSFAIRNLIGAGAIIPDDVLEEQLREEMDLPKRDEASSRIANVRETVAAVPGPEAGEEGQAPPTPGATGSTGNVPTTKQNAAKNKPGLPRQTKPSATPPRANGGTDRSGGK